MAQQFKTSKTSNGRNTIARSNALVPRPPKNLQPEGKAQSAEACETGHQLLQCLLKLRESAYQGPGKYHPPTEADTSNLPELPAHWVWASPSQLSSAVRHALAIGPFGSNLKVSDYQDEGVPLVFVRNIRSEVYADATKFVSESKAKELASHTVDPGDILVTKMGEPPGDSSIYPIGAPQAVITADCIKWRVAPDLNPKFFMYALRAQTTKRQITNRTRGVAQKKVSLERFRDLALPLPPISEQRRIVSRIEELLSRLDAGVAALRYAKAQLQRYRQSVLAAAVTGQLTQAWREQHPYTEHADDLLKRILRQRREEWNGRGRYKEPVDFNHAPIFKLPESWKWTSLDQLMLNITDGDHQAPPQTEVGIPFLVISNIRSGSISFDGSRFVRVDYYKSLDSFRTPSHGDILYSLVGSFGMAVPVKTAELFCVQRHIGILRPHSASPTSFLTQVLNSRFVFDQASEVSTGTAQKTVPLSGLRKIAIPLPPLAEQHQIVAEVEARNIAIAYLEAELDRQITRSNRLRQSTLSSAFQGDL